LVQVMQAGAGAFRELMQCRVAVDEVWHPAYR
jgi:hypothetical protein